jgi:HSP20 family protein
MLTLRTTTPLEIFDRLEQQLSQQLQQAERVPAAEVHETSEGFAVVLELPGVDKDSLDVKATDRTVVVSAERRSPTELFADRQDAGEEPAQQQMPERRLISEFRYGTWSRSFRFPAPIDRERLQARYRDGLLTVFAPKAVMATTVRVSVDS